MSKTVNLYYNVLFIFECFMTYTRKSIAKVSNQKVARRPKHFSFFFLFVLTLSQWFSHKTAAFYTEQCTSPLLLRNFEVFGSHWASGLHGNNGSGKQKQKHRKYCEVTKVTCIFNKLQKWASTIVIYDRELFSSVIYVSTKAGVFVSAQNNCPSITFELYELDRRCIR